MTNIKYKQINSETIYIFQYIHNFFLSEMLNTFRRTLQKDFALGIFSKQQIAKNIGGKGKSSKGILITKAS